MVRSVSKKLLFMFDFVFVNYFYLFFVSFVKYFYLFFVSFVRIEL